MVERAVQNRTKEVDVAEDWESELGSGRKVAAGPESGEEEGEGK